MCRPRRRGRICLRGSVVMSVPRSFIVPAVGSSSRMMQFATVDLPLPDSPTSPSVPPSRMSKLTPSPAWTVPPPRFTMAPLLRGTDFTR